MEKQIAHLEIEPPPEKQQIDKAGVALERLKSVRDWSPRELFKQLEIMGYVGQEETRRRLCLMAYRHIRRLKDHFLGNIPTEKLPPKSNVLMVGPTGCGKSYLAELLFGKILGVPVATVDMTGFVETGYMGRYVSEILYELKNTAHNNLSWAKMGICVLDEFDKISGAGSNIRFGGGGTTKDVSGYGVQRGLLKLFEGGKHKIPGKGPVGSQPDEYVETDCISFVACGAFTGIKELALRNQGSNFGFKKCNNEAQAGGTAYKLTQEDISSVEIFNTYGFLPELIGRFSSIARLNPLCENDLKNILKRNVLPKYKQEFKREGQKLSVPHEIIEEIVKKAIERKTGARGLSLLLTEYFENQAFELFGKNSPDAADDDIPF